jgi:hypothetical protein
MMDVTNLHQGKHCPSTPSGGGGRDPVARRIGAVEGGRDTQYASMTPGFPGVLTTRGIGRLAHPG